MSKKVIYCGQFKDLTGYGIAARSYLMALDEYLTNNKSDIDLKIYPIDALKNDILEKKYTDLIEKYSFSSQDSLDEFIGDGDYICLWHCPTVLPLFADSRFKRNDFLKPMLKELILGSMENYHLIVWETTDICDEWKEALSYFNPKGCITACEFNKALFDKLCDDVSVIPHPINNQLQNTISSPVPFGVEHENKFCILSMSQWDERKGFKDLIFSYLSAFEEDDDVLLILKTYPSPTHPTPQSIVDDINKVKASITDKKKLPPVILLCDFLPESSIKWLYEVSDVYATATKGEGFGLTIFESLLNELPVICPNSGGHIDFVNPESNYMVDGQYDLVVSNSPPYSNNSEWFNVSLKSLRDNLREAYADWKTGKINDKGKISKDYIVKNNNFSLNKVGSDIISKIVDDNSELPVFSSFSTLRSKIDSLENKHEGETLYILNCGPSLNEYNFDYLNDFLKDKTVFSIKQAFNYFPKVTDYHFFNCSNLPLTEHKYLTRHYDYTEHKPIVIASSNYDLGMRWSQIQKTDLFFKIPIRTEINNEFLTVTKNFDDYLLKNTLTRPCGPGIMYETVFFMAQHMGFKEIVCVGWDLRHQSASDDNYEHFYGQTHGLVNRGDVLEWELSATANASKELYYWLKSHNINIKVASSSAVYEKIERGKL